MAIGVKHIPWMSLMGMAGLGIGFLAGGGRTDPPGLIPALYGLVIGSGVGMALHVYMRIRTMKREKVEDPPEKTEDSPGCQSS